MRNRNAMAFLILIFPHSRTGRRAMIGLGFQEKSESFDFNAAIDTFKRYQRQEEQAKKAAEAWSSQPHESMALAEGATIHINIKVLIIKYPRRHSPH